MTTADRLAPHPRAALEYWFFKVNAGPIALIVDWIARRKRGETILRASVHSPHGREVLFESQSAVPHRFEAHRTSGRVKSLEWALDVDTGAEWIAPQLFPASQLRLPDMTLVSAPLAAFTGWIQHGAQRVELRQARGLISHYWGRQLPREWWWVSANQFDEAGVAVECMWLRSGLWGAPVGLPLAYLYLRRPGQRLWWIAPPATAQVRGAPEAFEIKFQRLGAPPVRLAAQGREHGDFGDGIFNTLVGDLEIWLGDTCVARAHGTAGLERRSTTR
jgi:hypothetical protein